MVCRKKLDSDSGRQDVPVAIWDAAQALDCARQMRAVQAQNSSKMN